MYKNNPQNKPKFFLSKTFFTMLQLSNTKSRVNQYGKLEDFKNGIRLLFQRVSIFCYFWELSSPTRLKFDNNLKLLMQLQILWKLPEDNLLSPLNNKKNHNWVYIYLCWYSSIVLCNCIFIFSMLKDLGLAEYQTPLWLSSHSQWILAQEPTNFGLTFLIFLKHWSCWHFGNKLTNADTSTIIFSSVASLSCSCNIIKYDFFIICW